MITMTMSKPGRGMTMQNFKCDNCANPQPLQPVVYSDRDLRVELVLCTCCSSELQCQIDSIDPAEGNVPPLMIRSFA